MSFTKTDLFLNSAYRLFIAFGPFAKQAPPPPEDSDGLDQSCIASIWQNLATGLLLTAVSWLFIKAASKYLKCCSSSVSSEFGLNNFLLFGVLNDLVSFLCCLIFGCSASFSLKVAAIAVSVIAFIYFLMDNNYEIRVASLSQARRANPRQLSGPYARIGTGAFGAVYRCSYNMNRAALKVFGGEGVNQEVTQLSYVERHPHIVEYFGELDIAAGQIRNPNAFMRFFGKQPVPLARSRSLLFEFAEHGSLSDYMRRHRRTLSAPMKKRLSRGVLKGLMYLHRLGIIHQDIKSDNILIFGTESRPVAKIGDFGIARCRLLRVVDGEGNTQLATPANFGPGGTGAYMAPEMVQLFTSPATDVARVFELTRRVNSSKIDIFSVGILLWVISTGRLPIRTREDLMAGVVLNNDNHLSQVGVFRRAVQACIAQTPNDRATAEGVLQLLR